MKVYNFKEILEQNGIKNPLDSELYYVCYCLESIGIAINPKGPWIAGGAVMKTYMGEPLTTDIDIFFSCQSHFEDAVEKMNKNAILVKDSVFSKTYDFTIEHKGIESKKTVQLIQFVFKDKASEIIDTFDLSVCQIAFDGKRVVTCDGVLDDIKNKRIRVNVNKISQPGSTLKRFVKYASRGYSISMEDIDAFNHLFLLGGDPPRKPQDWS